MGTRSSSVPTMGTNVGAAVEAAVNNSRVSAPATFESIEAKMNSVTALGQEGKAYVAKLTELCAKQAVIVEPVQHRIETVAAINHAAKQAVLIIFNESYIATQSATPVTEFMPDICAAFKNRHPDISMVQYIVVIPEDYERVENMATHVINTFNALDNGNTLSVGMFQRMKLQPCTDLKQVKAFVNQHSPHAIQDRADWGVLINRVVTNERLASYQTIKEPEYRPLAAVTGYTKFIRISANGFQKFLPVCIITNVTCTVPSTDILALALPIAAGCIITQRAWLRPYRTFAKDKPNLGRLFVDGEKKQLKFHSNDDELNSDLMQYMTEVPLLAMDCAEGRARIPGLEKYVLDGASAINEQLARFFGPSVAATFTATANQMPIMTTFFNHEGVYKTAGQLNDTRNGDFINMVTDTKDYARCQRALSQSLTPGQHIQDIAAIYGEDTVTPLYRVHTIIFNGWLINTLAQLVSNVVMYQSEAYINQNIDMAALINQFTTQIGGNNSIYGGYYGTVQPGNLYC